MGVEYTHVIPGLGSQFYTFEYTLFACIGSVFTAFICTASIQNDQIHPKLASLIYMLSRYSLGIFCINGILSQGFSLIGQHLFRGENFTLAEVFLVRTLGWLILLSVSLIIATRLDKVGLKFCVR